MYLCRTCRNIMCKECTRTCWQRGIGLPARSPALSKLNSCLVRSHTLRSPRVATSCSARPISLPTSRGILLFSSTFRTFQLALSESRYADVIPFRILIRLICSYDGIRFGYRDLSVGSSRSDTFEDLLMRTRSHALSETVAARIHAGTLFLEKQYVLSSSDRSKLSTLILCPNLLSTSRLDQACLLFSLVHVIQTCLFVHSTCTCTGHYIHVYSEY